MEKKQLNDKNCLIGKTFLFFINYEKMLSANLQFVQMVALALRLHWFGLLRNLSCSNRTKSSQIVNSLTLLFIFQKSEVWAN